jgi:7-cyano-7-deazaguanine synthase
MMAEKALVVLSGGQDSSTCLFWARKNFKEVEAIGFDYGQRHQNELEAAKKLTEKVNIPYSIMPMPLLNNMTSNALTRNEIVVEEKVQEGNLPNTFVDGRNMVFLTFAAIFAKSKNISHIIAGMGQTDFSGYPDCRDVFVKSLNVTLNLAMDYQFVLHTPLMFLTKAQTWALADDLGVMDVIKNETITCYNGIPGDGCGHCPACRLRREGLEEYLKTKKY